VSNIALPVLDLNITIKRGFIWIADTWLHFTSTTIQIDAIVASSSGEILTNGRSVMSLDPRCYNETLASVCVGPLIQNAQSRSAIFNVTTELEPSSNELSYQSSTDTIAQIQISGQNISYLAPLSTSSSVDFTTSTIAARSTCGNAIQNCLVDSSSEGFNFSCGEYFNYKDTGSNIVSSAPIQFGFFKDANLTTPLAVYNGEFTNPFYTLSYYATYIENSTTSLGNQDQALDSSSYIIGCDTELMNMTYTMVNGSIVAANFTSMSGVEASQAVLYPFLYSNGLGGEEVSWINWISPNLPSLSSREMTDTNFGPWSNIIDAVLLSSTAIIANHDSNVEQHQLVSMLVARIVKAPLWALITLLLASTLIGVVTTGLALYSLFKHDTHALQDTLSINGLVMSKFELPSELNAYDGEMFSSFNESIAYDDSARVGLLQSAQGKWDFRIWDRYK
jgi:hypothetical protein